jgi:hypothetical protein
MIGLPCLVCHCAKLHVAGWTWAVFTRVYLLFLWFLQRQSGIFWIYSYFRSPKHVAHLSLLPNNLTTLTLCITAISSKYHILLSSLFRYCPYIYRCRRFRERPRTAVSQSYTTLLRLSQQFLFPPSNSFLYYHTVTLGWLFYMWLYVFLRGCIIVMLFLLLCYVFFVSYVFFLRLCVFC